MEVFNDTKIFKNLLNKTSASSAMQKKLKLNKYTKERIKVKDTFARSLIGKLSYPTTVKL